MADNNVIDLVTRTPEFRELDSEVQAMHDYMQSRGLSPLEALQLGMLWSAMMLRDVLGREDLGEALMATYRHVKAEIMDSGVTPDAAQGDLFDPT